jgi:hypothetical protein
MDDYLIFSVSLVRQVESAVVIDTAVTALVLIEDQLDIPAVITTACNLAVLL